MLVSCAPTPSDPLRVGSNGWIGYENLFLAKELGYYDNHPIQLVSYPAIEPQLRAFRNGELEVMSSTISEALSVAETNPNLRVLLITDSSNGADVVVARPPIQNLADLKGKRIGVEASAFGSFMLARSLSFGHLTPKDLTVVPIELSDHVSAYQQKKVDAVITYEPVRSQLLGLGAKSIFDSSQIPGEIADVLVVQQSTLEKHKADLQALINGWFKAHDYAQTNQQDAAKRSAPRYNITTVQFLDAMKGVHIFTLEENQKLLGKTDRTFLKTTEEMVNVMLQNNYLKKAIDPATLLDDQLLKNVTR